MIGFCIKHNDTTLSIALPTGSFGLLISNKEHKCTICCNGIDKQGVFHTWYSKELHLNDTITIEYKDIVNSEISPYQHIRDVHDEQNENALLLQTYYKLKEKLTKEGVI